MLSHENNCWWFTLPSYSYNAVIELVLSYVFILQVVVVGSDLWSFWTYLESRESLKNFERENNWVIQCALITTHNEVCKTVKIACEQMGKANVNRRVATSCGQQREFCKSLLVWSFIMGCNLAIITANNRLRKSYRRSLFSYLLYFIVSIKYFVSFW